MDNTRTPRSRRTTRNASVTGAAVLVSVALLAGCGGADAPAQEPEAGATPSQASPTGDATTQDMSTATPTSEGGSPTDSGGEEAAADVVITIADYEYAVTETVTPGATITVRNEDSVGHTVTSDEEGLFDVAVPAGAEVTMTVPDEAGEYSFFCKPHPYMTATLVVG